MTADRNSLPAEAEMVAELMPCPFCGGPAAVQPYVDGYDVKSFRVECRSCFTAHRGACGTREDQEDAAEAWNTRAALSATPQPVAVPDDRPYCAGALAHIEIGGLCERHVNELRVHADKLRWQMQNDERPAPPHGWTCFHCAQTFTTWASASAHFGDDPGTGTRPKCVAVPDDGAGRDEGLRQVLVWAIKQWRSTFTNEELADAIMAAPALRDLLRDASALSAERAAHKQTRQAYRIEADKLADEMELNLRLEAEVARLRKALEEAEDELRGQAKALNAYGVSSRKDGDWTSIMELQASHFVSIADHIAAARSSREEGK